MKDQDATPRLRLSGRALLLGGGLLGGTVSLKAIALLTPVEPPSLAVALLAVPGILAALVGLIVISSPVMARSGRLAWPSRLLAGIAGVWLVVLLGWTIFGPSVLAQFIPGMPIAPPDQMFVGLTLLMGAVFAMYAVATFRDDRLPAGVGAGLTALAITWWLIVVFSFLPEVLSWQWLALYGAQPAILLATGWQVLAAASADSYGPAPGESATW